MGKLTIFDGYIADGNCRVGIYIHLLDLTKNRSEKCNFRSLAGIEPAALQFRCSALTNWATEASCRALTTSSCIYTRVLPCIVFPLDNFHLQYPSNIIHSSEMPQKSYQTNHISATRIIHLDVSIFFQYLCHIAVFRPWRQPSQQAVRLIYQQSYETESHVDSWSNN